MTHVWLVEGRKIGTFTTNGEELAELLLEARANAGDVPAYLEECEYAERSFSNGSDFEIVDVFTAKRLKVLP